MNPWWGSHTWGPLSPSIYPTPQLLTRRTLGDKRSTKAGISDNADAAQRPMFALRAERDHLRGAASG